MKVLKFIGRILMLGCKTQEEFEDSGAYLAAIYLWGGILAMGSLALMLKLMKFN